ncbi:hypothetical protein A9Q74_02780 [Colwellia sp. 39_35_sub15_T18]|nr:hypothetical protein A9Q74_02780 [Colwellia sp. 39_35_sub15_T18]
MNTFKKGLLAGAAALALSMSAQASEINVGGVVWDPDSTFSFPTLQDFAAHGNIVETPVVNQGDILTGFGIFDKFNSDPANTADFCPGCELTFTFSAELVEFLPLGGGLGTFEFKDLVIDIFVDHSADYDLTFANAGDGDLWLSMTSDLLSGFGTDLGTGSDDGTGSALLDVVGGLAMGNFDTNTLANGADLKLSSSFQPLGGTNLLSGTFDLTGDSIPEPSTIALLGLGLLGFASARKRKA